jgi:predicted transcriptional regulator of viral defense system
VSCGDIPAWYLRHRIAVLDVSSETWRVARRELLLNDYVRDTCTRRLVAAGRLRRITRGRFLVVDPDGEASPIAVASGLFRERSHYVTTDAALSVHGFASGWPPVITIVMPKTHRRIKTEHALVQPVTIDASYFGAARWERFRTPDTGHELSLATVEQAIADSIARAGWCADKTLVRHVLAQSDRYDLELVTRLVQDRGQASLGRLKRLLSPEPA